MAPPESSQITSREEAKELKIPFLSFIPKFPPRFFNWGGRADAVTKEESTVERKAGDGEESASSAKPNVVKFPLREPEVERLKLESEDAEQNSNPVVVWQVYILGGFILLKWAWAKWQERQANAKKRDSADDQSPADD